jgi:hypothetical protein
MGNHTRQIMSYTANDAFDCYADAHKFLLHIAPNAKWSSSFGNIGEGGFNEYWRIKTAGAPDRRFIIDNGDYDACPRVWRVTELVDGVGRIRRPEWFA